LLICIAFYEIPASHIFNRKKFIFIFLFVSLSMKYLLLTVCVVAFCLVAVVGQPKPEWRVRFSRHPDPDNRFEKLHDIILLSDGRIAGVGETRSREKDADSQGLLLLFGRDRMGRVVRESYGSTGDEVLNSVAEAPDGTLYAVGKARSNGCWQPYLLHLNRKGKQIGLPFPIDDIKADSFEQIRWLSTGAALISTINVQHGLDTWLLQEGVLKKNQSLPAHFFEDIKVAIPTPDGGVWLSGNTHEPRFDFWCRYFDAQGKCVGNQNQKFGEPELHETLTGAALTPDGSLLLAGQQWEDGFALPLFHTVNTKNNLLSKPPSWPNQWTDNELIAGAVCCTRDNRRLFVLQSGKNTRPCLVEMSPINVVLDSKTLSLPHAEGFQSLRILEVPDEGNLLIAGHNGNGKGGTVHCYWLQRTNLLPHTHNPNAPASTQIARPSLAIRQPSKTLIRSDGFIHIRGKELYIEIDLAVRDKYESWYDGVQIWANGKKQDTETYRIEHDKSEAPDPGDGLYHHVFRAKDLLLSVPEDSLRYHFSLKICYGDGDTLCNSVELLYGRRKPTLYVLAIGANGGQGNSEVRHAFRDAQAMTRLMQAQACDSCLFENVVTVAFALEDSSALTFEKIRQQLIHFKDILKSRAGTQSDQAQDCIVLSFSGHGEMEDGEAYLLASDANEKKSNRLHFKQDFMDYMAGSKVLGKKLVFVDACRTQVIGGRKDQSLASALEVYSRAAPDVFAFLSCADGQSSWESDELKHGIFTYALEELLDRKPDSRCPLGEQASAYLSERFASPWDISNYLRLRVPQLLMCFKPEKKDMQIPPPLLQKSKTDLDFPIFWLPK